MGEKGRSASHLINTLDVEVTPSRMRGGPWGLAKGSLISALLPPAAPMHVKGGTMGSCKGLHHR